MGNSKKVNNDFGDEIGITEKALAGMAGKWGKKTLGRMTGGRLGRGGATGDKIKKPINKKDEDGNQL